MTRSSSLTLARRLALGFACVLTLLIAVALVGALSTRLVSSQLKQIVSVNNVKTKLANAMMHNISRMAVQSRTVTLLTDVKAIEAELKATQAAEAAYAEAEAKLKSVLESTASSAQERKLFDEIVEVGNKTRPLTLEAAKSGAAGDNVQAMQILSEKVRPVETVWQGKVDEFVALQEKLNDETTAAASVSEARALVVGALLVVAALGLGSWVGWRITLSVTRPVGRAVAVAERIADGDLSGEVDIRTHDEIGRLLMAIAAMQDRLRSLVGEIRHTADSIQVASGEVAAGNQDLSHRTEQTAANLQQAASSIEQLSGAVQQSFASAKQADGLASSAAAVAERGGRVMDQVVTTMNEIHSSSKQIADIIGVIDSIAFQTNILALNAAVEAARAGEQGRGFAVVASEVRSLAQRSAEAAKQIKTLIGGSVERVDSGSTLVAEAGRTMQEIVGSVQRVSHIIGGITSASAEQSTGIGAVSGSVTQLDHMTQRNAALVEESAAAAAMLRDQAQRLTQLVRAFRLTRAAEESPHA